MTDRDVVKEALEKADSDGWGDTVASIDTYPQKEIATFLKHILEAGPDERMISKMVGLGSGGLVRWSVHECELLIHLVSRLEEQTHDNR